MALTEPRTSASGFTIAPNLAVTAPRRRIPRPGREWYLDSITGRRANDLEIPLEFLGKGDFIAEIYSDAADADANPKHTAREEKRVNASTVLRVKMASGGGQAVRIRAAK